MSKIWFEITFVLFVVGVGVCFYAARALCSLDSLTIPTPPLVFSIEAMAAARDSKTAKEIRLLASHMRQLSSTCVSC